MYKDDLIDLPYNSFLDDDRAPDMPAPLDADRSYDPLEEQLTMISGFYNVGTIDELSEVEKQELFYDALDDRSVGIDDCDLLLEYGVDIKSLLRDRKRGIITHEGLGKILEERIDEALTQMIQPMLSDRYSTDYPDEIGFDQLNGTYN